jgi:hypothetical protein
MTTNDLETMEQPEKARISSVYLSALFAKGADFHIFLQIKANNAPDLEISIIHNSIAGVKLYNSKDNDETALIVQHGECLAIIAYYYGDVVGAGIYQVDTTLIEEFGKLLTQCVVRDIHMEQDDFIVIERSKRRALNAACPVSIGDLVAAGEVR